MRLLAMALTAQSIPRISLDYSLTEEIVYNKLNKMLNRILLLCLVFSASSSLSCRWMDHKFRQFSDSSLALLNTMDNSANSTEEAELENTVAFPNELYRHASKAPAVERLSFVVQVFDEIIVLFEEDQTSASWDESAVDNFLNVITQQADGLRSCIGNHSHHKKNLKKLRMYFKRLSHHVLEQMDHSAEAWELIRTEVRLHLQRAHVLASSLHTKN